MKRKTATLASEDDLLLDLTFHNVPASLLTEFAEKIVQPYYQGNMNAALASRRQICAFEAKNLVITAETKTVAGDTERRHTFAVTRNLDLINEEARGLLTKFMAYLEREGFAVGIQYPGTLSHLVKDGANLVDPENAKSVIAKQRKRNGEPWSDSMKMLAVCAYDAFCQMQEIHWKKPIYHQNEATVAVPDEKDLDLLISATRRRMATFLLCLKETFADPQRLSVLTGLT
jgi:hypothetical protein